MPAGSREAIVAPDIAGFSFEEENGFNFSGREKGYRKVLNSAAVGGVEDEPIGGSAYNLHPIRRFAEKIVLLVNVEASSRGDLVKRKILAALVAGGPRHGVRVNDQRLPTFIRGRPIQQSREGGNSSDAPAQSLDSGTVAKSPRHCHRCRAGGSPTGARSRRPVELIPDFYDGRSIQIGKGWKRLASARRLRPRLRKARRLGAEDRCKQGQGPSSHPPRLTEANGPAV